MPPLKNLAEITGAFFKLGCISFGGPVAHLGYLRDEFVARRHWLDDEAYADLVALCQFLPGPASSQVVFALGMQRAGLAGAILASVCFTLPSAVLMILFGYGVTVAGDFQNAGWLHGLKLAAVAVVAQAVWGMGKKLCPDRARLTLALLAAATVLAIPGALGQIGAIMMGAIAGWCLYRGNGVANEKGTTTTRAFVRGHLWALGALVVFAVLLVALPVVAMVGGQKSLMVFDSFYRAGSLVFGGGHVVLPLLRAEVVPVGWIDNGAFVAGYGAAQAMPGPLFTFAAYLGTVIHGGPQAWTGGLWCLLGIFLPAWLLVGGVLPFWHLLRKKAYARAALAGANAAVVGVLLAALWDPVWKEGVTGALDVMAVLGAFALLEIWRVAPWCVVLLMAAAAQFFL
ncbi:chromate efflux transporter [Geminisphaera colitermitum]|uniref:chromate efflux transporter n=1 Tax=Geminisphaera colitermitum TaxID=1148786 RepID=UPI001E289BAA|nr:chromate efflux transporter [Geminisphaera colitermitum]